ncbi:MAG: hypothetical protein WCL06_05945 [Bacteroidota bacterium]
MEENNIQEQINQLNQKMDILLEYVQRQNSRSEMVDDLVSDVAIIGKDIYDTSVEMLDQHAVEINPDEVKLLVLKLLRNVNNISMVFDTLESFTDLMKDAAPIANEVIIDFTKKLHEFETKGYFDFIRGIGKVMDHIITSYSREDFHKWSENIPAIMDIARNASDPKFINFVNSVINEYNGLEASKTKKYTWWKLLKEMNSPQFKQTMGMTLTLVKNVSDKKQ